MQVTYGIFKVGNQKQGAGIMDIIKKCGQSPDKIGKFTWVIIFVLSVICFFSDPPIITIVLSVFIIAAAIICLARKHKLKGFFIVAIIITAFTLLGAVGQADEYGLFNSYPTEIVDGE